MKAIVDAQISQSISFIRLYLTGLVTVDVLKNEFFSKAHAAIIYSYLKRNFHW